MSGLRIDDASLASNSRGLNRGSILLRLRYAPRFSGLLSRKCSGGGLIAYWSFTSELSVAFTRTASLLRFHNRRSAIRVELGHNRARF